VRIFKSPILAEDFDSVITLSTGGTLTPIHGRTLTALKCLLRQGNVLPPFLRDARPGALGFRNVSQRNWPRVVAAASTVFLDESQLRAYLLDFLLADVKDRGTCLHEECRCSLRGVGTGRCDYFIRVHGRWIPVEAKLNVLAERDLPAQMRKYLRIDGFNPQRGPEPGQWVPGKPIDLALVADSAGVYILRRGTYVDSPDGRPLWPRRTLSHRTGADIRARLAKQIEAT